MSLAERFITRIFLKFPTSTNKIWRNVNGRGVLSAEARHWRTQALNDIIIHQRNKTRLDASIELHMRLSAPDRRRRDIDNYIKSPLDVLVKAKILKDDSQVKRLVVVWDEPGEDACEIEIYGLDHG